MAGGCVWSRRIGARARTLRALVKDTQRALQGVSEILSIEQDISSKLNEIGHKWTLGTALVVFGCNSAARVRLVHALLGTKILPDVLPRGCRWIRIQYGSSTQVHLSLGNSEFELVEDLECNTGPWETLPLQDLKRQESTDQTTIIEIEINNQFLKDGLQIIIPPDIDTDPGTSNHLQLKNIHSEFYTKRSSILKTFHPVYLYAVDKMGKNIFADNICGNLVMSKSEQDFWSTYGFFNMNKSVGEELEVEKNEERGVWTEGMGEPAVFDAENCLDLHQIKQMNSNAQLLFILFADAVEDPASSGVEEGEATESSEDRMRWNEELPEADRDIDDDRTSESPDLNSLESKTLCEEQIAFMNELIDQWELMTSPPQKHYVKSQWYILDDKELLRTIDHKTHITNNSRNDTCVKTRTDKFIGNRTVLLNVTVKFATDVMQSYLLEYSTKLSEIHVKLLQQFIMASFDMARELQIVPKKIQYAAMQEQHLYETIHEKFYQGEKKHELVTMMQEVLQEMKTEVANMDWSVDDLPWHRDSVVTYSSESVALRPPTPPPPTPSPPALSRPPSPPAEEASDCCLDEYELIPSFEDSYAEFYSAYGSDVPTAPDSIPVENERSTLLSHDTSLSRDTCHATVSLTHATLDVQQTVLSRLSRKISMKLVKFVVCLKEAYFGTLERCVESLEQSCEGSGGSAGSGGSVGSAGSAGASAAVRALWRGAGGVALRPAHTHSLLRSLLDTLARILHRLRISSGGESCCCPLSAAWRRRTAIRVTQSLSAHRLARIISQQILENLSAAHERYQAALSVLVTALTNRLHQTEDIKLAVRKKYAPLFARLCLESTSMCDLLMHGTPDLGREIGRGQYGVVFAVRGGWGGRSPLAAKSVLPHDTRHYHDLAMEFFYARSIPPHPRIVPVYGCITRGSRGVLLLSARKVRDLHAAVRAGLTLVQRMLIACDIIEGIRYLHSLGLVHRDIKLKNVLLDGARRAALADLGFCTVGALLSGSVVGTPVHMAPELLHGDYCASVDIYAFGILFWYLCAGDVKLPAAFETFNNKEQLWSKVKKGVRPERLPWFEDSWWDVMSRCWRAEAALRPLPGDLQPALRDILQHARGMPDVPQGATHTDEDDDMYHDF